MLSHLSRFITECGHKISSCGAKIESMLGEKVRKVQPGLEGALK
jgi:hypothetical protein